MKAKALQPGDTIGIIAPASAPQIHTKITKSVRYFERLGFNVELGRHVMKPRGYLAAKDSQRLDDLHSMFRNKSVRAIFYSRRVRDDQITPEIDYELIRRNPKIIVGYSDATALFNAVYKRTGLESMFFGPMAGVDIWKNFDPFAEECMWKALTSKKPLGKLPTESGEIQSLRRKKFVPVTGKMIGGNLTVFSSIVGTPFVPELKEKILFFEDIGEKPYRVDRYLAQLRAAGVLGSAKGIMLGQFCDCEPSKDNLSLTVEEVFRDYFDKLDIPVLLNLPQDISPAMDASDGGNIPDERKKYFGGRIGTGIMEEPQFDFRSSEEKKTYVRNMFSHIAGRYDFLNHFLSFGLDHRWRKKAVGIVKSHLRSAAEPRILDIACGTGDLAFELLKQIPAAKITGIDLAKPMLDIFQQKIDERKAPITIGEGDVEALTFADNSFDAVTIGFGTRNFTRLDVAFKEITRVLKPDGILVNLELSKPRSFPMKQFYGFYSHIMMPAIGKLFSEQGEAYTYLPDSIDRFPEREEIMKMLHEAGFAKAEWIDLTQGVVTMHVGTK